MSALSNALEEYLAVRRGFGFKLENPARALRNFVAFADRAGASHVTTELALRWAQQPAQAQPSTWAFRLGIVRRFASWRGATDPRTEIPPPGLLPYRYRRKRPYIYSDDEVERIVAAARQLPSSTGLRAHTHSTFFGLLAVTGMRMSEALALDRADVDLKQGVLTIRRTKFGKSRLVALHASTCEVLKDYAKAREALVHARATPAFFVSPAMPVWRRSIRSSATWR
jgi:integrase